MWYVVQVASGKEARTCRMVERAAQLHFQATGKQVLKECFAPMYQVERKFRGEYRLTDRSLFPGYVIAITSDAAALNSVLKKITSFAKILGNDKAFIPLDRTEMKFIDSFTVEKHRVIHVSRAVAEGDAVKVLEGPMVGHEGWIVEINRRKGTARIETEMFGHLINVEIGLAVMGRAE